MVGESNSLSLSRAGSLRNAAFGGESAGGVGVPEFEVIQNMLSGLMILVASQSGGRAGGVTPSKFSVKNGGHEGVGVAVGVGVGDGPPTAAAISTRPQP